jgi:tetrahydromethanopterin S-methyltransferase subunit G
MNTSRRRAFLNGLVIGLIGLAVYMLPAFVVAFRLASELSSQRQASAVISAQISQQIGALYAQNWLPQIGLIIIVGLAIAWRVRAVRRASAPGRPAP